jgi:multiple sugar transport system substrate-binding protein
VTVPVELPTTLALAGRFSAQTLEVLDKQIARFEAGNSDARVELVRAPKGTDRWREWIATRLSEGDSSVDILLLNATWPAEFAAGGGLVPLDGHLKAQGVDVGAFLPNTIEANTLGGQLVALPWTADAGLLYYRGDLLERHGYSPPATWADLQRIALDVKDKEGLPKGFVWHGAADENLTCSTLEFLWHHGGDVLDEAGDVVFESPEARAALQQMSDFVASGASPQDVATTDDWQAITSFKNGEAVFLRSWLHAWEYLSSEDSAVAGQVGIAPLPAACLGGQSLALSGHSNQPDKALRLMAFLTGYEQQVEMALAARQPPVLKAAYQDANLLAQDPRFRVLQPILSHARSRPSVPTYAQLSEAIYSEVNQMLAGAQGVEATAIKIQNRIESIPK